MSLHKVHDIKIFLENSEPSYYAYFQHAEYEKYNLTYISSDSVMYNQTSVNYEFDRCNIKCNIPEKMRLFARGRRYNI